MDVEPVHVPVVHAVVSTITFLHSSVTFPACVLFIKFDRQRRHGSCMGKVVYLRSIKGTLSVQVRFVPKQLKGNQGSDQGSEAIVPSASVSGGPTTKMNI